MSGVYAADGSINITVVDGSTLTGLYAADGSINVVKAPGSTYVGIYHPCGAWYVTEVTSGVVGYYAADGSMNVAQSPYTASGAVRVTVVSGSLSGGGGSFTYTSWTPTADSKLVYVDPNHPSATDIANDGTNPSVPLATPQAGWAQIRTGHQDALLLKQGRTIDQEVTAAGNWGFGNNGFLLKKGPDADHPIYIGNYSDTGLDPNSPTAWRGTVEGTPFKFRLWTADTENGFSLISQNNPNQIGNLLVQGLIVDSYKSNPGGGEYNASSRAIGGLSITGAAANVTFEDFHVRGGGINIIGATSVKLRRASVAFAKAMGLYLENISDILLEQVFLHHCGWYSNDTPDTRNVFNHNVYGQDTSGSAERWRYLETVSIDSSDVAFRMRHGGQVYNNLIENGCWGIEVGGVPADQLAASEVTDNVILDMSEIPAYTFNGGVANAGGPPMGIVPTGDGCDVSRNLINRASAPTHIDTYGISQSIASANTTGSGNRILGMGTPTSNSGTNNNITGTVTSTAGMPAPNRTLNDYAVHIGLADRAALISSMLTQHRGNYDSQLSAAVMNDWFREGCGMEVVG